MSSRDKRPKGVKVSPSARIASIMRTSGPENRPITLDRNFVFDSSISTLNGSTSARVRENAIRQFYDLFSESESSQTSTQRAPEKGSDGLLRGKGKQKK